MIVMPGRGESLTFRIELWDVNLQVIDSPVIVSGDFQISKDFGSFSNLTTLPTVEPGATGQVRVDLTPTEMTADNVLIRWVSDQDEWLSGVKVLQPTEFPFSHIPDIGTYQEVWDEQLTQLTGASDWLDMPVSEALAWLVAVSGHKIEQRLNESILYDSSGATVVASSEVERAVGELIRGRWE